MKNLSNQNKINILESLLHIIQKDHPEYNEDYTTGWDLIENGKMWLEELKDNTIKIEKVWVCNECNFPNFTDSIPQEEIDAELHSCIHCGGFEFHLINKK